MKKMRVLVLGLVLWLVPFVLSVALFGIHRSNRPLFESLIAVIVTGSAVVVSIVYVRAVSPSVAMGALIGVIWAAISIAIDLPLFLKLFHMPLGDYLADIGLIYLIYPIVAAGIAHAGRALPPGR